MNEENKPKVSLVSVDLSTTVKPIAITEEEALEKIKKDNATQAQFKDEVLENVETNVTKALEHEAEVQVEDPEQKELVEEAMKEANERMDVEAFNRANKVLDTSNQAEMSKVIAIILAIIILIIVIILIIEIPSFIETFN